MAPRLLQEDLDPTFTASCEELWPGFARAHLFITGATGFFGKWLLETLLYANDQKKAGATDYRIVKKSSCVPSRNATPR